MHTRNAFVHTHNTVDDFTASCNTMHCTQHTSVTFVYMLYYVLYFAGDSMLIMRSHGVSTAVKRDAADDI